MTIIKKLWKEVGLFNVLILLLKIPISLWKVNKEKVDKYEYQKIHNDFISLKKLCVEEAFDGVCTRKRDTNERAVKRLIKKITDILHENGKWSDVLAYSLKLSNYNISDEHDKDLMVIKLLIDNKLESDIRYHKLNKGENDYWEWYLTPWHRNLGWIILICNNTKIKKLFKSVLDKYDRMYEKEKPWMTRIVIGSNITSVLGGYSLYSLHKYFETSNITYLRRYKNYITQYHKCIQNNYDTSGDLAIPTEGLLYGGFILDNTTFVLSLIQKKMGLNYVIYETKQASDYPLYTWLSRTSNNEFQAIGDSKSDWKSIVSDMDCHIQFKNIYNNLYSKELLSNEKEHWLLEDVFK